MARQLVLVLFSSTRHAIRLAKFNDVLLKNLKKIWLIEDSPQVWILKTILSEKSLVTFARSYDRIVS